MSETINISNFDFYFDFKSDDYGLKQIDEPIGMDGINLVTDSDDGRYARDVFFGGNDKVKLTFTTEKGSKDLGFEFDKLVEYDKVFGYESEIDFIIKNRVTDANYILGQVEYEVKETDHYSFFRCNIVQVKNQALLKRLEDTKIDVFNDEDLDGNEIEPVQYSNILIPAKPVIQRSSWFGTNVLFLGLDLVVKNWYFNVLNGSSEYEIKNSLSFIPSAQTDGSDFKFIETITDLTDVNVVGENISFKALSPSVELYYKIGTTYATASGGVIDTFYSTGSGFSTQFNNINYDFDIVIPEGDSLWMYFKTPELSTITVSDASGTQTITATSTPVDTVTKGVRLLDATKQVSKSINSDFVVNAPRIGSLGEHYNQFLFSGDMVRGRENPFNIEWKDLSDYFLSEPNLDYQVKDDELFIGKEDDYYANVEIASFLEAQDSTFNIGYNPRFSINDINTKFGKFNQDKDDENTIDAVHTKMELLTANRKVQNTKDVKCSFVRDPFLLATTQIKAITETSTSLEQDNTVFIGDCITIAPSQTRSTRRRLNHNVNSDGNLQLLGEALNWSVLGFVIGDVFTVVSTGNSGTYTVLEINDNIVTLEPLSASPTSLGVRITEVSYPLTDVQYILRTNEGFDSITGVESPTEYANLKYTLKRSLLENRGAYLKTATAYKPEDINVTYLKNNVDLRTQFNGGAVVSELDPITQDQLPSAILSPRYITCKVLCTFEQYTDFKIKLETINDTDTYIKTIGGFVRIVNNNGRVLKGYPKKSDFTWANGVMDLELEEKYQSPITNIYKSSDIYFIDEVGYDLDGSTIIDYSVTNTDYIQFFDSNTRPLTNVMKYDLVSIDNTVFDNVNELIEAIENL